MRRGSAQGWAGALVARREAPQRGCTEGALVEAAQKAGYSPTFNMASGHMRLAACDPQMGANEAHAERVRRPRKRYCGASWLVASALDNHVRAKEATILCHGAPRLEVVHGPHVRLCHAEIVTDEKEVGKQP